MFPDRRLQLKILEELKNVCPNSLAAQKLSCFSEENDFAANIWYLEKHGLIVANFTVRRKNDFILRKLSVTEKGVDFLEDDGGIAAILNKVHIKFDKDDLTALLTAKIAQSSLPAEEKKAVMDTIKSLPAEGVKTVYTHLLNLGLKNLQDIPQLIQRIQEALL